MFQKKSIFVWFILFFLAPHLIIGQNNNSTSSETLIPLEYGTFSPPAVVGESYNDPVFSTSIKRLTNSQSVFGFNGERAIFSADDKYFVVAVDLRVQKTRLHFSLKAKAPNNWMMYPLANKVLYWKGTISQEICMILNFSKQFIA
ncbi:MULTISPECIES: hypothetical protein [Bacteroidota]|uniref:hypothetical protein n=1 Tax=Polaribacter sp. TaxID=1920175 RepID=UPI004047E3DC